MFLFSSFTPTLFPLSENSLKYAASELQIQNLSFTWNLKKEEKKRRKTYMQPFTQVEESFWRAPLRAGMKINEKNWLRQSLQWTNRAHLGFRATASKPCAKFNLQRCVSLSQEGDMWRIYQERRLGAQINDNICTATKNGIIQVICAGRLSPAVHPSTLDLWRSRFQKACSFYWQGADFRSGHMSAKHV